MAHEQDERVSALVDDELEPRQLDALLAQMRKDDTLRARMARYQLMSDALHNNLTPGVELDLSRRVSAALEQEPVIFAPVWQRLRPSRRSVKRAAGAAVAASFAAAAILVAQWNIQEQGGATVQVAMEQPANDTQGGGEVWERNLDSYLANHNEYAAETGMHGVLPSARLVSYASQQ